MNRAQFSIIVTIGCAICILLGIIVLELRKQSPITGKEIAAVMKRGSQSEMADLKARFPVIEIGDVQGVLDVEVTNTPNVRVDNEVMVSNGGSNLSGNFHPTPIKVEIVR